jgi:hypothetical protein
MASKLPLFRSGYDVPACQHSRATIITGYTMATGSTGFHESPETVSDGIWTCTTPLVSLMELSGPRVSIGLLRGPH